MNSESGRKGLTIRSNRIPILFILPILSKTQAQCGSRTRRESARSRESVAHPSITVL